MERNDIIATTIFFLTWLGISKSWSFLPTGRTGVAILASSLMVILGVINSEVAFKSISGETILLLSGLMIILGRLEKKGIIAPIKKFLIWDQPTPLKLLFKVSILSSIFGAIIMNDGAAIFLSDLVLQICLDNNLPIEPFSMAIATSANIGSTLTVIGNPKNMLIIELAKNISFFEFSKKMFWISLIATLLNSLFLVMFYYNSLINYPLIKFEPIHLSKGKAIDEDLWKIQQEYINTKSQTQVDIDKPASTGPQILISKDYGTIKPKINETQNFSPNTKSSPIITKRLSKLSFCEELTESPQDYTFTKNNLENKRASLNQSDYDSEQDDMGILSPTLSFSDLEDSHINDSLPTYSWPVMPSPLIKSNDFLLPIPIISNKENYKQSIDKLLNLKIDSPLLENELANASNFLEEIKFQFNIQLNTLITIGVLLFMYLLFILGFPLGWSCVLAAALILFNDQIDVNSVIIEHINWGLIVYLIGIFIILAGVQTTPLPSNIWNFFSQYINLHGQDFISTLISTLSFSILIIILSFIFTSIPTVLLVAPYMDSFVNPKLLNSSWYLLAWCVTISGNCTPFGSVAGLIVSEISKNYLPVPNFRNSLHSNFNSKANEKWIGDLFVWLKFAGWSTTILLIAGSVFMVL